MKRGGEEIDHPDTCDCDCPTIECCAGFAAVELNHHLNILVQGLKKE